MPASDTGPLPVDASSPVVRNVVEILEFSGRLDSINLIEVRARVTGFIMDTPFKEGDIVTEKTILFKIDDRQYKAKFMDAEAQLELARAKLTKAKADNSFAKKTAETPGAISQQDLVKYQAGEDEGAANVKAMIAQRDLAKQNYDWCTVRPETKITGRAGRYLQTKGNLINQDSTLLTTVVAEDPIYAYCDADEMSLLKVRRGIEEGRIKPNEKGDIPVYLALGDEKGFPHKGLLNYVGNTINPLTGTIQLRATFENPLVKKDMKDQRRLMTPGMFVKVSIPLGDSQPAVLVAESCLVTDQGLKNVYLVDENDKIVYRRVELGPLQPDGLRVITSGLDIKGKDRVLINELQMVRPGMEVKPTTVPMPVQEILEGPPGATKVKGK